MSKRGSRSPAKRGLGRGLEALMGDQPEYPLTGGVAELALDEIDTVLSTSSGLQNGDRFMHGSIRLFPDSTYSVAVACINADAAYRLSVRRGQEVSLSAPRRLGAHEGLTADEATRSLIVEDVLRDAKAELVR